ncbi:DNA polymerase kappa [Oopsacas minuta]|uniref:DNA polymerase kappa n=1 Tax=Oopsacas minuta TaxID=111878 RepID=A0AAV7K162_9METZ|nr:DNA polymerase kappa [Oopsacas minuta]
MSQEEVISDSEEYDPLSSGLEPEIESLSTDTDSRMALNTNKAGMEGLDKDKINKIIIEASKGSKFYINQKKRQEIASKRNMKLKQEMERITKSDLERAILETNYEIELLESTRDLSSIIVHVDMDAFYASVEMRDDPSLRDIPMAVGGSSMLSTSNYVARKFGVRAGMPGFIAKKLCPDLKIVGGSFDKYRAVSKVVRGIFHEYDPDFSPMGLDEAYINITQHVRSRIQHFLIDNNRELREDPVFDKLDICSIDQYWDRGLVENIVREMRGKIEAATQLTASAGIAVNTMLSKICSDMNKPNGQFFLPPVRDNLIEFIRNLPVRKVCGIGKVTEEMLKSLGIIKVQQLYEKRAELKILMTDCSYQNFLRIFMGLGSTELEVKSDRKSRSTERTFPEISNPLKMYEMLEKLSSELSDDLKKKGCAGYTIGIKLKTVDFEIKTRVMTIPYPTNDCKDILTCSRTLLDKEIALLKPKMLKLRLMGVKVSGFGLGEDELNQTEAGESKAKRRKLQPNMPSLIDMFNSNSNSFEPPSINNSNYPLQAKEDLGNYTFRNSLSQQPEDSPDPNPQSSSTCPICSQIITGGNLTLNKHIDSCLNKRYIRDELSPYTAPIKTAGKQCKSSTNSQLSIQSYFTKSKDNNHHL